MDNGIGDILSTACFSLSFDSNTVPSMKFTRDGIVHLANGLLKGQHSQIDNLTISDDDFASISRAWFLCRYCVDSQCDIDKRI